MPNCVIAIRFNVGISVAVPAAVLCINRRLYLLASPTSTIPSQADMNRELIIDLVIGIGLPIIVMVLCPSSNSSLYKSLAHPIFSAFLVQTHRFMIAEDYGCSMPILTTWVTLVFISIPPILLEIIAGVYGCLSIRAFYNRCKSNGTRNNSLNLGFNSSRYIRLICFSACDLLVGIPVMLFYLYMTITSLAPFPGLTQEHNNFSQILQLPAAAWRADTLDELSFELNRWIIIFGAFVFFAIFGFTEESRNNYRAMLQYVVRVFMKITGIKCRRKTEECVYNFFFFFSSLFSV